MILTLQEKVRLRLDEWDGSQYIFAVLKRNGEFSIVSRIHPFNMIKLGGQIINDGIETLQENMADIDDDE